MAMDLRLSASAGPGGDMDSIFFSGEATGFLVHFVSSLLGSRFFSFSANEILKNLRMSSWPSVMFLRLKSHRPKFCKEKRRWLHHVGFRGSGKRSGYDGEQVPAVVSFLDL